MSGKMKIFVSKEELEKLYIQTKSAYKIAKLFNVNYKTVYSLMNFYGIATDKSSQGARKNFFNESFFENIDTKEKAYWLGFIMADGCVYASTDKKSYRLQINLKSTDIEHLHKFQKAIGSNYKIQVKKVKTSEVCILKINSTKMCKDLINNGVIERKSIICEMPHIDNELLSHFVRGYFDGDGCLTLSNNKTWCWSIIGGESILSEIQKILPSKTTIYKIKHSKVKSLETSKIENVKTILKWLYNNSNQETMLTRKYNKYMSLLGELLETP